MWRCNDKKQLNHQAASKKQSRNCAWGRDAQMSESQAVAVGALFCRDAPEWSSQQSRKKVDSNPVMRSGSGPMKPAAGTGTTAPAEKSAAPAQCALPQKRRSRSGDPPPLTILLLFAAVAPGNFLLQVVGKMWSQSQQQQTDTQTFSLPLLTL